MDKDLMGIDVWFGNHTIIQQGFEHPLYSEGVGFFCDIHENS